MNHSWQQRKRPNRLENRYEFVNYDALREFLDQAADLSEKTELYPDMGFGRDYVNITIHADEDSGELNPQHLAFAEQLETLRVNLQGQQD